LLDDLLESRQRLGPKAIQLIAHGSHSSRVRLIDPAVAVGPARDEPRVLEHLQVLRHGGPGDRELDRELAHRTRAIRDTLEDRAPRWIPQRSPSVNQVSSH
jgi:hypothetical protein